MPSFRPARRSFGTWVLLVVAIATSFVGGVILVATALGFGHADVRGVVLRGTLELIFLIGLGIAVAGAATAAFGFLRDRPWAVWVLAAVWPTFASFSLYLDRAAPAPGPGRSLTFYLLEIGLLPASLTLLLGWLGRRREPGHGSER